MADAYHVGIMPNLIACLIFGSPNLVFYFFKLQVLSLIYTFMLIFLLLSTISHVKWPEEINKKF